MEKTEFFLSCPCDMNAKSDILDCPFQHNHIVLCIQLAVHHANVLFTGQLLKTKIRVVWRMFCWQRLASCDRCLDNVYNPQVIHSEN